MRHKLVLTAITAILVFGAGCQPEPKVQRELFDKVAKETHRAVTPEKTNVHPVRQEWINENIKKRKVDLLFIGDSITHGWNDESPVGWEPGGKVWYEYYGDINAFNAGLSSDRTEHLLWRLQNGIIGDVSPKVVVVMIGTNNNVRSFTPQQTADGVIAICSYLRENLAKAKILLLGIFPCDEYPDNLTRKKNIETNKIISKLHDGKWIYYMDIGAKFLEEDGTISKSVLYDFLHPSEKGYRIWAEAIKDKLAEMLQ